MTFKFEKFNCDEIKFFALLFKCIRFIMNNNKIKFYFFLCTVFWLNLINLNESVGITLKRILVLFMYYLFLCTKKKYDKHYLHRNKEVENLSIK